MLKRFSLLLAAAVVVFAWWARAEKSPASGSPDLRVTELRIIVSAMQGTSRSVTFRGVLEGYQRGPAGELQNLACVFATKPGAAVPKEYDASAVRIAGGNIQPNGEFFVDVPLYLLNRRPRSWETLNVRFVGPVSLRDEPPAIFKAPVLGETDVLIGDMPVLSDEMQLVNSGPSVLDANYDPLLTIRTCNSLMRMSKDRALLVLRSYTYIAAFPVLWYQLPVRPESLDTSDLRRVIELLHLVCEPRAPTKELLGVNSTATPSIELGDHEDLWFAPKQGWHPLWYLGMVCAKPSDPSQYPGTDYPFVIEGDVPFYVPELLPGRTGYDSTPGPYLTLFEKYGQFRERGVYQPTGTLAEILEGVISRIPGRKQELCDQALALLPPSAVDLPAGVRACAEQLRARDCEPVHLAPADCDALREWLRRTPLVWDKETEAFVKR